MEAVETLHSHGKLFLNHYSFNCIIIAMLATLCYVSYIMLFSVVLFVYVQLFWLYQKKLFSRLI